MINDKLPVIWKRQNGLQNDLSTGDYSSWGLLDPQYREMNSYDWLALSLRSYISFLGLL